MSVLMVKGVSKSFGSRDILRDVSFHIEEKSRVGFVGANGVGKTTLFRILTGNEEADAGEIVVSSGAKIGYMQQHVPETDTFTAVDYMLEAFAPLLRMEEDMEFLQHQVEAGNTSSEILIRLEQLRETYQRQEGLTFRGRVDAALTGLGFSEEQKRLPLSSLSGGQRSKVGLARLLLSGSQLLLLDEPTNHLDLPAIQWLEEFLLGYNGAFVVISHDRYFLDRVTGATMELERSHLQMFAGNYTAYAAFKKEQREIAQSHYEQQMKEIHRLEDVVTEMRRWNREKSIKRAESKQKVIDKLSESLEKPESECKTIRFHFSVNHTGPNDVFHGENLGFSFPDKELYQKVDLHLKRGERVFLVGGNGCGKTTLLRQIMGEMQGRGDFWFGPGVTPGYYDQTQQQLTLTNTVLDEVWNAYPHMEQTAVRNALAAFLFTGDDVFKTVEKTSGGERARIALLKTMLSGCNLLLLDEPTNHLDVGSREALEEALVDYDGTLLMVSHDRYFINKLADRVMMLTEDGLLETHKESDLKAEIAKNSAPEEKAKPQMGKGGLDYKQRKERESRLRKLRTAVARAEEEIELLEQECARLEERLQSPEVQADYQTIMDLTTRLEETKNKIEEVTWEWSGAAEALEQEEAQ